MVGSPRLVAEVQRTTSRYSFTNEAVSKVTIQNNTVESVSRTVTTDIGEVGATGSVSNSQVVSFGDLS